MSSRSGVTVPMANRNLFIDKAYTLVASFKEQTHGGTDSGDEDDNEGYI